MVFADAKRLKLSKFQYAVCNSQSFWFSKEKCSANVKYMELVVAIHKTESLFLIKANFIVTNKLNRTLHIFEIFPNLLHR